MSVMIVSAEKLKDAPKAFQQYVREWFVQRTILGKRCFVAGIHSGTPRGGYNLGNAPSHSVDLMGYTEGLPPGQKLRDWIDKAEGKFLWTIYAARPENTTDAEYI